LKSGRLARYLNLWQALGKLQVDGTSESSNGHGRLKERPVLVAPLMRFSKGKWKNGEQLESPARHGGEAALG
jgi:hypothetical protein